MPEINISNESKPVGSLVQPIFEILDLALKRIPDSHIVAAESDRHKSFAKQAELIAIDRSVERCTFSLSQLLSYMKPVLDDFWFIGKGACSFALDHSATGEQAKNLVLAGSQNLSTPANCPENNWQWTDIKSEWVGAYATSDLYAPKYIFMICEEDTPRVNYTQAALDQINSYTTPDSGCPARGRRLDQFFKRYIETIFV